MEKFVILRDASRGMRPEAIYPRPGPFGTAAGRLDLPPEPRVETADLSSAELRGAARDPEVVAVARAMPIRLIEPRGAPTAASAGAPTWGVARVGATASPFDGAGVRVAVLDTGIDATHPAFAGVNLIQKDFTGSGNGDGHGHGTHCAGTIFGRDVGGTRIGVAPGVTEALIGKVLGADGSGGSEMLFAAMNWASEENARVISMSLGFDFPGLADRLVTVNGLPVALATSIALEAYRMNLRVFDSLMDLMRAKVDFNGGTVVCAASGNESERQIAPDFEVSASVPAAALGVVSVGALAEGANGLTVAPFSNTNPVVSAPGVGVVSAWPGGGLKSLNGTSMACPHVAGVTALWWQALGAASLPLTSRAVEARLLASAVRTPFAPGVDTADRGQGLVQAPTAAVS
ncbi:MAG: S8 family serine peptidase [Rhodobacteraceae bacterium]|jgi:subtilisin family serine protease|uniref:S8 family peptidase n=1 Tax=Albidovulum sp. TaxID=1872424 RepID=UPI002659FC85|nr:S8 family serine peptidase [uncultured Defluviimonas sp.]MCC0069357.1 S8 family serine peptidase [Paracoccaceae bacterium]